MAIPNSLIRSDLSPYDATAQISAPRRLWTRKLHAKGGPTADIVKTESAKVTEGRSLAGRLQSSTCRSICPFWPIAASPAAEDVHPGQRVSPPAPGKDGPPKPKPMHQH
eukprot:scaffold1229_cov193-Alexandrium_tamarense.AAC.2